MPLFVKALLIVLPWVLLTVVVGHELRGMFAATFDGASTDHILARTSFIADLAYQGCVTREVVIAQAEARGWYRGTLDEFPWCHAPTGLSGWLHIDISPPLPFSTEGENAAYIGFDARGCMADWTYASGPGSTCP